MTVPSLHDSVLEQRAAIRGMVAAAARAIHDEIRSTTDFLLAEIRFADDPLPVTGVSGLRTLERGARSRTAR